MLNAYILIAKLLSFVLRADQDLVEVPADIYSRAGTADLGDAGQGSLRRLQECLRVYTHLLYKLQDQAVFYSQKTVKQMFLLDLLISVFIGKLFALVDSFNGLLCKFLYIHA